MRHRQRTTLLLILGACLAAAAGCGSDDEQKGEPIPADTAAVLAEGARLGPGAARQRQHVGACDDVFEHPTDPNVDPVNSAIAGMPENVDAEVRSALQEGFDNLFQLVGEQCDELRQEAEQQQETDTAEPEPEPPPTETEETAPTETDTEPSDTEPEPPATEPDDGGTPPGQGGTPPGQGGEIPGEGGGAAAPEEGDG